MVDVTFWNPPDTALPVWQGDPPGYQSDYGQPVPTLTPYLAPGSGAGTGAGVSGTAVPAGAVVVLPGGG